MFDTADILRHRHPPRQFRRVKRSILRLAGKAQKIPTAVDESIQRIGFTLRRVATLRAINVLPRRVARQGVAGGVKIHILGQSDGQVLLGHRNHTADLAMDEGDRRAPIALTRNAPITQPPHGLARTPAARFGARDDGGLGIRHRHAVQEIGVHQGAGAGVGLIALKHRRGVGAVCHNADHRQGIFAAEIKVALVMRGHAHNGAGAVIHQHEIGDVNGQSLAGEGVRDLQPGVKAQLLHRFHLGGGGAALFAQFDEGGDISVVRQALRHRVIRRHRHKIGAEDGVWAGGIDLNRRRKRRDGFEMELQALRLADPVFLHQPHLFGPIVQRGQPLQQFFGKIGDFQEPLAQLAFFDQSAAAPAAPVDHLFIGQHRMIDRVPIDRRFLAVHQPCCVEIQEQRLLMPVIFRLAGGNFAAPIQREAQPFQLCLHVGNIVAGPAARVDALFHRGVFGGHTEGIPAHRVQHLKSLHPLGAGQHVSHRVIAHMANMDAARWVGKHLQHERTWFGAGVVGAETLRGVPRGLPARISAACIKPASIRPARIDSLAHTISPL